jgi:hypothetical protein
MGMPATGIVRSVKERWKLPSLRLPATVTLAVALAWLPTVSTTVN